MYHSSYRKNDDNNRNKNYSGTKTYKIEVIESDNLNNTNKKYSRFNNKKNTYTSPNTYAYNANLENELLKKNELIGQMKKESIRTKSIIEGLRNTINEKNKIIEEKIKIIEEKNKRYLGNEKDNRSKSYKNIYDTNYNKYSYDIKQKNEQIIKENIENKKIIENLKKEIYTKTKIIEENKNRTQYNVSNTYTSGADKNLIDKLKKEICSKNYTIMDYKTKLDKMTLEDTNNKKIITNLKNEIYSKDKLLKNNPQNSNKNYNNIIVYDTQNKSNQEKQSYQRNIETIKETHLKEINRYKEILKQKETEIIRIKNENEKYSTRSKSTCCKHSGDDIICELQRIINDLKKEIKQLYMKLKDYDSLKAEIEKLYKRGNFSFKEINSSTLKLSYEQLIEENKQLKEKMAKLQKNK